MKASARYTLLLTSFLLFLAVPSFAQQYSLRDQEEIAYQAGLTLQMYQDLLNVIAYEGLASPSEVQQMIKESYTNSRSQIFFSEEAIIEDDVDPYHRQAKKKQDKAVGQYLRYFDLAYQKEKESTVEFYDYDTSHLKYASYPYIKIQFTSHFKGQHKEDPTPYQPVKRVAEFRAEKEEDMWKTYITSIVYADPAHPVSEPEGNVQLDTSLSGENTLRYLSGKINSSMSSPPSPPKKMEEGSRAQDSVFRQHMERGSAALAAKELQAAFAAFTAAGEVYPNHPDLRQKLLELADAQNQLISSPEESFAAAKRKAEKALAARDYVRARNFYAEAIRLNPEAEELKVEKEKVERVIRNLAVVESKFSAGDYKGAIRDYSKAIRKNPDNPDYYFGRARSYEQLKEIKDAIRDYSRAIELDGNFVQALSHRARLYSETENYALALADYSLIVSNPEYAATFYPERAKVKQLMGDLNGALADYREAIRYHPEVADYHYQKGMILLEQKEFREAVQSFSMAVERAPQHAQSYYHRGMAYAALEQLKEASNDFNKARVIGLQEEQLKEIERLSFRYFGEGEKAMAQEDFQKAVESFADALLLHPGLARGWLRRGDAYYALQEYDRALRNYEQAIRYDEYSLANFKRGLSWQQKNRKDSAAYYFSRFIPTGKVVVEQSEETEESPGFTTSGNYLEDLAEAWYALGYAQLMTGGYKEARESLDEAIEINQALAKAWFARGSAYFAIEEFGEAVKDMEESIRLGLSDPMAFYALGNAYMAHDQQKQAIFSYSHALQLDTAYVAVYLDRARAYSYFKQYDLALQDLEKALSLQEELGENAAFLSRKALLELRLGKVAEASQLVGEVLQLEGQNAWALYVQAAIHAREGRQAEALESFRQAFQSGQIEWASIKDDPLIQPFRKQKAFRKLVKSYL